MSDNYEAVKVLNYQKLISDGVINPAPKCACGISFRLVSFTVHTSPMTHALLFSNFIKTKTTKISDKEWRVSYWSGRYLGYSWHASKINLLDPLVKQETDLFCSTSCRLLLDVRKSVYTEFTNFLHSDSFQKAVDKVATKHPKTAVHQSLAMPRKVVQLSPFMLELVRFYKQHFPDRIIAEDFDLNTEFFKSVLRHWVSSKDVDAVWKDIIENRSTQLESKYTWRTHTRTFNRSLGSYFPTGLPIYAWIWADDAINKGKFYPRGVFVKEEE